MHLSSRRWALTNCYVNPSAACQAVCTEAGMFALRERRIHVTQEDFDMAVAKVMKKDSEKDMSVIKLFK
jgi:26S proteasome regulatory subunit T6